MFIEEDKIQGWCPVPLMEILNRYVGAMKQDQSYLEIGTFCGRSLIAALKDNSANAIVIDPLNLWTQNGNIKDIWDSNIDRFNVRNRITLYRQYTESFCSKLPSIGIFFYDGNHDSGHTYEALNKFREYLADEAIIIVDDYNIYGGDSQNVFSGHQLDLNCPVKTDTDRWTSENKDSIRSVTYTPWLNGQAIIQYARN